MNERAIIQFDKHGRTQLPGWVVARLIKMAGLRSKKKRIIKKVVKREFCRLIRECYEEARLAPKEQTNDPKGSGA